MSNLEKAIRLAIEGGWINKSTTEYGYSDKRWQLVTSDPLFWSSLGKALGWEKTDWGQPIRWLLHWHEFIDHLASGGDAESFLASLLPHPLEGRDKQESHE